MPKDTQKEQIKVTDKRIFTPDGNIREEFRDVIKPAAEPVTAREPEAARPQPSPEKAASAAPQTPRGAPSAERRGAGGQDRRRTMTDAGANPGTPFTNFLEPLIAQAYMSLGLLPNPYQPQAKPDAAAARQMIDILTLLKEKTAGNLTPEEDDFFESYLAELKLTFVKVTKSI